MINSIKTIIKKVAFIGLFTIMAAGFFAPIKAQAAETVEAQETTADVDDNTKMVVTVVLGGGLIIIIATVVSVVTSTVSSLASIVTEEEEED